MVNATRISFLSLSMAVYLECRPLGQAQAAPPIDSEPASPIDKTQFNIFNPTPTAHMRQFATDRPDKTESAYSVDAGHFQHETDILNFTYDSEGGDSSTSFFALAPNLKVGLTNRSDLQIVLQPYNYSREDSRGGPSSTKHALFLDPLVRLKVNLWGNDSGDTVGSIMPYLKLPTNRSSLGNNSLEGGLMALMGVSLSDTWSMGLQTQVDFVQTEDSDDYHYEFLNSVTFGTSLTDTIGTYGELWTMHTPEGAPQATGDIGFTYSPIENTQFDAGVNTGLTDASDDINPFIGISQRF